MNKRIERDSMGEFEVPGTALYGAQTARAVENFPISGRGIGHSVERVELHSAGGAWSTSDSSGAASP